MAGSAVDEIAVPLARGERPPVWGLNLNVFPQGQADFAVPFAAWVSQAAPLLSPFGCYLYDTQFLHVTASSPAPFTNGASLSTWVEEEKARYSAAWLGALQAACKPSSGGAEGRWPRAPFPLVFKTLRLDSSCAIFLVEDPTGSVAAIRECVAVAAQVVEQREPELFARSGWKTPKIIHSTVMRIVELNADAGPLQNAWAQAAALWPAEGVTILCKEMTFLKEVVAYQHMGPNPNGPEYVIETFPYG